MHGWRLPPGKICLFFKTLKNFKIADPVLTMNSFYDKDNILQKKLRYYSESKIPVAVFVLHAVQPDV